MTSVFYKQKMNDTMNKDNVKCPKCNSENVQTEGMLQLCLDCGYKWEDAPQTDLGEMIIYQSDEGVKLDVRLENIYQIQGGRT